jgi:hypothetical protein
VALKGGIECDCEGIKTGGSATDHFAAEKLGGSSGEQSIRLLFPVIGKVEFCMSKRHAEGTKLALFGHNLLRDEDLLRVGL